MQANKKKHECGLCKSWIVFTAQRCTNPNCPHYETPKKVNTLPSPLGQLTDDEVSLLYSFLLHDGNLTSTAKLLETTKYHVKERIKKLKAKIEVLASERAILDNYISKNDG